MSRGLVRDEDSPLRFRVADVRRIDRFGQHYAVTRDQSQGVRATTNFLEANFWTVSKAHGGQTSSFICDRKWGAVQVHFSQKSYSALFRREERPLATANKTPFL